MRRLLGCKPWPTGGQTRRSLMAITNPYLPRSKEFLARARKQVEGGVRQRIDHIAIPGDFSSESVTRQLKALRRMLKGAQDLGLEDIVLFEESKIPELAVAISVFNRASIRDEVVSILNNLMVSCGIPTAVAD